MALLEGTEGRLEHARSLLELGAALRRQGVRTEARERLRAALDAPPATERAASPTAPTRSSSPPALGCAGTGACSGRESLTASEDRVALLAAQGLTNREIAQRQFVTVKAVQWHLRNIYRKLDVSSREELPTALDLGSSAEIMG